jgi:hypothetical protein
VLRDGGVWGHDITFTKFTPLVVANGHVYVPSYYVPSYDGRIIVYGLA